ncbi:MAG: hypothetical protein AAGD35_13980 [Actinomycetota bacterium]
MESGVTVLLGQPRWPLVAWFLWSAQLAFVFVLFPSTALAAIAVITVLLFMFRGRFRRRRALWLTDDAVVITNARETHVVPMAGASASVVSEEEKPYLMGGLDKPHWDNTPTAVRRLVVVPAAVEQGRIEVEAGMGVPVRRLRAVAEELNSAFKQAS